MSVKENLDQYVKLLNPKTLSLQTIEILKDYQKYFELYPNSNSVEFATFGELFFINLHPNMDDKKVIVYRDIFNKLTNLALDDKSCVQIITSFEQQEFYAQLHRDLDNNVPISQLSTKVQVFDEKMAVLSQEGPEVEDMDLEASLKYTDRSKGLQWRLNCLNEHFEGGLIKGDFVVLAGYVDSGKTGFLCSELSRMAEQLEGDQWIAWLNTEGTWQQTIPRIYCATLNCTVKDLVKYPEKATLKYTEKMNGNKNRIQVLNYQRKGIKDVEKLCKVNPPSLIVMDLLDAFQGFERHMGSEGNSAERYGALYQWARVIATETCPVIAVSQLNRNGNDNPYPPMTELSGSGEKKQGAATAMIMLGSVQGNDTERYLSTPKNKMGGGKGFRCPVKFDPLRSRFSD